MRKEEVVYLRTKSALYLQPTAELCTQSFVEESLIEKTEIKDVQIPTVLNSRTFAPKQLSERVQ